MSHFAQVIDGIVQQIIVAEQDFINTLPDKENWIQTSYNTKNGVHYAPNSNTPDDGVALRGNYAKIGGFYHKEKDVFCDIQPYDSWTLNETTWTWEAPIPYPNDEKLYRWSEDTLSWIEIV